MSRLDQMLSKGRYELRKGNWKVGFPGEEATAEGMVFANCWKSLGEAYEECFETFKERTFVVADDRVMGFSEFWEKAQILAAAMARCGVQKGDRVGIVGRNTPEYLLAFVAATLMGGVVVPLNSWWKGPELEYGIIDAGLKVIFADPKRYENLCKILGRVPVTTVIMSHEQQHIPVVSKDTYFFDDFCNFECPTALRIHKEHVRRVHVMPDDTACIMYTSGSTGHPKGVTLSHRGICHSMFFTKLGYDVVKSPPIDVFLCPVPMFHVTASHHVFLASLVRGGKMVLMERWDPKDALEKIQREKVNRLTGVPTMMQDLLEHPDFHKYDTSSLRGLMAGGAPTPVKQVVEVSQKFSKAKASSGYGLTETNGGVATIRGKEYLARPTSVGKPGALVKFIVVKPGGTELVPDGESGELLIKTCMSFTHYWKKKDATREALVSVPGHGHGWFRTGDVGKLDAEGYCYLLDRVKDIIIRGGENISCAEVESAFFSTGLFHEVACFGLKHSRFGEVPAILLRPKANVATPSPQHVLSLIASALASFKTPAPENIFFTTDPLPKGGTGKTLKRVIRNQYNAKAEDAKLRERTALKMSVAVVSPQRVRHVEEMAAALMEKYVQLQGEFDCVEVERDAALDRVRELEEKIREYDFDLQTERERYNYVTEEVHRLEEQAAKKDAKYAAERQQLIHAVTQREYQWEKERTGLIKTMKRSAGTGGISKKTQTEAPRMYDRATLTRPPLKFNTSTSTDTFHTTMISQGTKTTPTPVADQGTNTDCLIEEEDDCVVSSHTASLSPLSSSPRIRSPRSLSSRPHQILSPTPSPYRETSRVSYSARSSSPYWEKQEDKCRSVSRGQNVVWTTDSLISEMLKVDGRAEIEEEEREEEQGQDILMSPPIRVIAPEGSLGRETAVFMHSPPRERSTDVEEEVIDGEVEVLAQHSGARLTWPVGALCKTNHGVEGRVRGRVADGFIVETPSSPTSSTFCRRQDLKILPSEEDTLSSPTLSSLSSSQDTYKPRSLELDKYPRSLHPGHYQQTSQRAGMAYTPKKYTLAKLAGC